MRYTRWKKRKITEKGLKGNVKKTKVLGTSERIVAIHAQYVEEEYEEAPFYSLNVTIWCIKEMLWHTKVPNQGSRFGV